MPGAVALGSVPWAVRRAGQPDDLTRVQVCQAEGRGYGEAQLNSHPVTYPSHQHTPQSTEEWAVFWGNRDPGHDSGEALEFSFLNPKKCLAKG